MTASERVEISTHSAIRLVETAAALCSRYGLVVVISWIGAMKFADYEAQAIQPLIANSPLMSWLYDIFSVSTLSAMLGVFEIFTALLLAVKPLAPKISAAGSVFAVGLFLATISFLFTTPGVSEAAAGGFPLLSSTGTFLLKDVALLGISLWTLADALRSASRLKAG